MLDNKNIELNFSDIDCNHVKGEIDINKLLIEALSYGYHAAKDELKGINSSGYMTRFFEKHNIK